MNLNNLSSRPKGGIHEEWARALRYQELRSQESKVAMENDLTRESRPEARYWRAPIIFRFGSFTSDTMRLENVHIPYHTGKGYGSSYVYMCLPGFVNAVHFPRPIRLDEEA
jgi:hypothetical protein